MLNSSTRKSNTGLQSVVQQTSKATGVGLRPSTEPPPPQLMNITSESFLQRDLKEEKHFGMFAVIFCSIV